MLQDGDMIGFSRRVFAILLLIACVCTACAPLAGGNTPVPTPAVQTPVQQTHTQSASPAPPTPSPTLRPEEMRMLLDSLDHDLYHEFHRLHNHSYKLGQFLPQDTVVQIFQTPERGNLYYFFLLDDTIIRVEGRRQQGILRPNSFFYSIEDADESYTHAVEDWVMIGEYTYAFDPQGRYSPLQENFYQWPEMRESITACLMNDDQFDYAGATIQFFDYDEAFENAHGVAQVQLYIQFHGNTAFYEMQLRAWAGSVGLAGNLYYKEPHCAICEGQPFEEIVLPLREDWPGDGSPKAYGDPATALQNQ